MLDEVRDDRLNGWALMTIGQCKGRVPVHNIVSAISEIYRIRTKSFDER